MAEKRMFSKQIIDSDMFLDMPLSAQALYFHLAMRADDDGFLNNSKKIQRVIGASDDDLRILLAKRFLLAFDDGIVVIKHWRIHNYIAKDRYKCTVYQEEKAMLDVKESGAYTMKKVPCIQTDDEVYTECIQIEDGLMTQNRIDKISIDKNRDIYSRANARHSDEINEVIAYLNEKTGKRYKASGDQNRRPINARLGEGFKVDDFKKVIDTKTAEWKGTEMEQYLRPQTLFGTKFESYLNQKPRGMNAVTEWLDKEGE